jgi:hypothetical protein
MAAKIKNSLRRSHLHRPKGVSPRSFEKVYWPYLPLVLLIAGFFVFGIASGNLSQAAKTPFGHVLSYAESMENEELLLSTNQQRIAANINPLTENAKLDGAALAKANDMAKREYWAHQSPDGNEPWSFVTNQSYIYTALAENLATGFNNEKFVIKAWMASSGHRENMLDPKYSEVGFGSINVPDYRAAGGGRMTLVVAYYANPGSGPIISPSHYGVLNLSTKSSHSSVAFASLPIYGVVMKTIVALSLFVLIAWALKHVRALHSVVSSGEKFIYKHPLFDFGLIIFLMVSYLLSQTSGIIH